MRTEEFISKAKDLGWGINKTASTIELVELTFPADGAMASISEVTRNLFETHYYDVVSVDDETLDLIVAYTRTPIEDRKEPENKHFVKDTKGEIIMTFNEAVQAMLKGKKVTWEDLTGHRYIMLNDKGNIVDDEGDLYRLYRKDFIKDWKIVNTPSAGTLLSRYGKPYRLIKDLDGTYAILDVETYVEQLKGITEESLMRDLTYYDIVK